VSFYSENWYRVADLTPRLRSHVKVHRHVYRGQPWYLLQDDQTGQFMRLSYGSWRLVSALDGHRKIADLWHEFGAILQAEQPSQDEIIHAVSSLYRADLIHAGKMPDGFELTERAEKTARTKLVSRFKNPMAIRIKLFDPDRFLTATLPVVRWLWSLPVGLALGALWMGAAALALMQWDALGQAIALAFTAPWSFAILALIYPIMKALHELGHAYTTKFYGGEVHEIGLMFLLFMPVPYVDASASLAFENKWHRAFVAAAGIIVELILAAGALVIWTLAEPGFVRDLALQVAIMGGVSTLLFNGNPLLRFDGYHVFADLIEIPNLGQRSNAWLLFQIKQRLLRIPDLETPATTGSEPRWFAVYGLSALAYRMVILWVISLYLLTHFFVIGVVLTLVMLGNAIVLPLAKAVKFLLTDPSLSQIRRPAMVRVGLVLAALALLLFTVPVPYATRTTGVVWPADEKATLRSGATGDLAFFLSQSPVQVAPGEIIARISDPEGQAGLSVLIAEQRETALRFASAQLTDRALASALEGRLNSGQDAIDLLENTQKALTLRAPTGGLFVPAQAHDQIGQMVQRGQVLGYLIAPGQAEIRTAVPQDQTPLILAQETQVHLRFAHHPERLHRGVALRISPAALTELPHPALSDRAGGHVRVDPAQPDRLIPLAATYGVDFTVATADYVPLGLHVDVKFQHAPRPLGLQIWRRARQVFLDRLPF
jgi:putative peptide zinc metalloprotease protein